MSKSLNRAKATKNDEFYTQLRDIEKELKHYRTHFKDKIVYCNCDDPEWSNFYIYFREFFEVVGLKRLITTHYESKGSSYILTIESSKDGKKVIPFPVKTELKGNGDFRSEECIEILKNVDIVITNPPFSLFREYVAQLVDYDKKFLIIGNVNAMTCKDIFPFIKENKVWLGISPRSMNFKTPDGKLKAVNACWYTNLIHKKRKEELYLTELYDKDRYHKYDNYDAVEISKVNDIPKDYKGVMGVPITFLEKYNPNQFEIIGNELTENVERGRFYTNGNRLYARILIKNKKPIKQVNNE